MIYNMQHPSGIYAADEINFSRFIYSREQISKIEFAIERIKQFFHLALTEQNFNAVSSIWSLLISVVPLPAVQTNVYWILRSRPSKEGQIFEDEADISYNTKCPELIQQGRFNRAQEAVFYGVLPSDQQEKFVNAATIESYKELISDNNSTEVQYFHLCKFNLKQQFPVLNLCFEPRVLRHHPWLNEIVNGHI